MKLSDWAREEEIDYKTAYASIVGKLKFEEMYGLSSHHAAALAIARRYYGYSERPPSTKKYLTILPSSKVDQRKHNTWTPPVWMSPRHVSFWWSQVLRSLPKAVAPHSWAKCKLRPLLPGKRPTLPTGKLVGSLLPLKDVPDESKGPNHLHRSDGVSKRTVSAKARTAICSLPSLG